MNLAIPTWRQRVSPVYDVAGSFRIVTVEHSRTRLVQEITLHPSLPGQRAEALKQLAVDVLICGALSRQSAAILAGKGIKVVSHVCGEVDQVVASYLAGDLETDERFIMPGCAARHHARRHRRHRRM